MKKATAFALFFLSHFFVERQRRLLLAIATGRSLRKGLNTVHALLDSWRSEREAWQLWEQACVLRHGSRQAYEC